VAGNVYYAPSSHGFEREVADRMSDQGDAPRPAGPEAAL
jgi:hypothetical protein